MARRPRQRKYNGTSYRSGLEVNICKQLEAAKIPFEFEQTTLQYFLKIRKGSCEDCKSTNVYQEHWYTPDFILLNSGIIVETKGQFISKDRTKMLAVREQHPDLDIRMLFYADSKLTKGRAEKCSDWCKKHNFKYAIKTIPQEWLDERKNIT